MRRRSFLAAATTGATVGVSGCLSGEVVVSLSTTQRVPASEGWSREIDEPSGSGELTYTVRSERHRFEVFYFKNPEEYQIYQRATRVDDEMPERTPVGDESLRSIAVENPERDAYEAEIPRDGGRTSVDFDRSHYLVVDNSNYGEIELEDPTADLPVSISLEVVEDRF